MAGLGPAIYVFVHCIEGKMWVAAFADHADLRMRLTNGGCSPQRWTR